MEKGVKIVMQSKLLTRKCIEYTESKSFSKKISMKATVKCARLLYTRYQHVLHTYWSLSHPMGSGYNLSNDEMMR